MRIAFFSTLMNTYWGGSEILWYKTALHMQKNGVKVAVFIQKWENESLAITILRGAGAEVFFYDTYELTNLLKRVIRKLKHHFCVEKNIFNSLFKWNPDFIFFSQSHSYDLGYFTKKTLNTLLQAEIPFCVICQNNTDYSYVPEAEVREKIKWIYSKAKRIFFVSKRNKLTAEHITCYKIENSEIISNSISLSPNEIGVLSYPDDGIINFACVARLRCSHKGQNLLLDVLSQSVWLKRPWILNLYGSGEDEKYLKELVVYLNLTDRVNFKGQVSDIRAIWAKNHILLLPSFGEGMPLALQEAMLSGRPSVVTDVGGSIELIEDNVTGWIANGNTLISYSQALERAWSNKKKWEKVGQFAYEKAVSIINFHPEETLFKFAMQQLKNNDTA